LVDPALDKVFSSRRLALAFAASLALHAALALWPAEQALRPQTAAPLLARIVARPEPAPAAVKASPSSRKLAAQAAKVPSPGGAARVRRVSSTIALPADGEAEAAVVAQKLSERQRRIPRSATLAQPATPRKPIRPRYPPEALAAGIRGHVLLEAIVGVNGRAQEIIVLDDNGLPQLAQAAVAGVRRTPFVPAREAGGAVRSRIVLRVEFSFE
jgi:protein TonB